MTELRTTRKTFIVQAAAGWVAFAAGCGSDDSDGAGTQTDATTGPPATTSAAGSSSSSTTDAESSGSSSSSSSTTGPDASSSSGRPGSSSGGSSSGSSTGEVSLCVGEVIVGQISQNHGHVLEVPVADIVAGVEMTYDVSGTAGHCHAVTLMSEDFEALRAGEAVTKLSCNGGDHEYVISCAAGAKKPGDPTRACLPMPATGTCV